MKKTLANLAVHTVDEPAWSRTAQTDAVRAQPDHRVHRQDRPGLPANRLSIR
jgi:hypothetical protein